MFIARCYFALPGVRFPNSTLHFSYILHALKKTAFLQSKRPRSAVDSDDSWGIGDLLNQLSEGFWSNWGASSCSHTSVTTLMLIVTTLMLIRVAWLGNIWARVRPIPERECRGFNMRCQSLGTIQTLTADALLWKAMSELWPELTLALKVGASTGNVAPGTVPHALTDACINRPKKWHSPNLSI